MKPILFTTIVLLMTAVGCQKKSVLTNQEKESVSKEVEVVLNQIMDGWNTNNIKTAFPVFADNQDFTMIGVDGSMINYPSLIDMSKQMFETVKHARYILLEKTLKIIDENLVIALGIYSCETTYPDGKIEKYPKVGSTFVFQKTNGKWLVTHFHESSLAAEVTGQPMGT